MKPAKRGRKPKIKAEAFMDSMDTETTCEFCFAEFLDPEDLLQHKTQVHPSVSENSFKCSFCPTSKGDVEEYLRHLRDEHMAQFICCMYCARAFVDPTLHKAHEAKHRSDVSGMLTCSKCLIFFNSIKALEAHELICNKTDDSVMLHEYYPHLTTIVNMQADKFMLKLGGDSNFTCQVCKMETTDIKAYLRHLKRKKCRSYACNNCSGVFVHMMNVYRHFKYHPECLHISTGEKYKVKCSSCHKTFEHEVYKNHKKRCKAIQCSICKEKFETVQELTTHQRIMHPMSLVLRMCRYCQQQFGGLLALRKHMKRMHRDSYQQYKYVCVHCNNIYKHPDVLFKHFAFKHKDLKPYSCKICNEMFSIRRKFTLHIKLKHESAGFVEFDEKFNVYFSKEKSANAFQPKENTKFFNDDEMLSGASSNETEGETDAEKPKKVVKKGTTNATKTKANAKSEERTDDETDAVQAVEEENKGEENMESKTEEDVSARKKRLEKMEPFTRKRRRLQKEIEQLRDSSDDEPLSMKKRCSKKRLMQMQMTRINKYKFSKKIGSLTCNICKKFCFTVGNYHRHMSMHYNDKSKQCIKCSERFTSKEKLEEHFNSAHQTSQITSMLKKLLERRKFTSDKTKSQDASDPPAIARRREPMTEKFQQTIKKVYIPPPASVAKLELAEEKGQSVKNFIESFTPDVEGKKNPNYVTVTPLMKAKLRPPKIKLTKFVDRPYPEIRGLKMPKAINASTSSVEATIKLHHGTYRAPKLNFGTFIAKQEAQQEINYQEYNVDDEVYQDDDAEDQHASIPEVAQEVMLENSEEHIKTTGVAHKLVIPKSKLNQNIKIAHLQPEAPFFKIVSINDVMNQQKAKKTDRKEAEQMTEIQLPSGTKLVHTNPLAHLLEGKSLDRFRKFTESKKKYQPRHDHKTALLEALINLENPKPPRKRPSRKKVPRAVAKSKSGLGG